MVGWWGVELLGAVRCMCVVPHGQCCSACRVGAVGTVAEHNNTSVQNCQIPITNQRGWNGGTGLHKVILPATASKDSLTTTTHPTTTSGGHNVMRTAGA